MASAHTKAPPGGGAISVLLLSGDSDAAFHYGFSFISPAQA
ncbi:MAG: hypothetical protein NTW29_12515 [Bacteroidetes bacterium]|nr:hypothetical protein [Bacteroidota bacterium]